MPHWRDIRMSWDRLVPYVPPVAEVAKPVEPPAAPPTPAVRKCADCGEPSDTIATRVVSTIPVRRDICTPCYLRRESYIGGLTGEKQPKMVTPGPTYHPVEVHGHPTNLGALACTGLRTTRR